MVCMLNAVSRAECTKTRRRRAERPLPTDPSALVLAPQVQRLANFSRATLDRYIAKGLFPRPDKILPGNRRMWRRATVDAWLHAS